MRKVAWLAIAALSLGLTEPTFAQTASNWNPEGFQLSRADLNELLVELDNILASTAYSGELRDRAERDRARIQERLTQGDFSVGDRIILDVEGEVGIPDSLPVEPGPRITLPVMGAISLQGVLRSELERHLTTEIGRFVQNPTVHARSMIRLSIQGSVLRPGYYAVPAETLVGDAIMIAGGPSQTAAVADLRLMRGSTVLLQGEELQGVISEGRTLDQLSLRAGDQLLLPERGDGFWQGAGMYIATIATSLIVGVLAR